MQDRRIVMKNIFAIIALTMRLLWANGMNVAMPKNFHTAHPVTLKTVMDNRINDREDPTFLATLLHLLTKSSPTNIETHQLLCKAIKDSDNELIRWLLLYCATAGEITDELHQKNSFILASADLEAIKNHHRYRRARKELYKIDCSCLQNAAEISRLCLLYGTKIHDQQELKIANKKIHDHRNNMHIATVLFAAKKHCTKPDTIELTNWFMNDFRLWVSLKLQAQQFDRIIAQWSTQELMAKASIPGSSSSLPNVLDFIYFFIVRLAYNSSPFASLQDLQEILVNDKDYGIAALTNIYYPAFIKQLGTTTLGKRKSKISNSATTPMKLSDVLKKSINSELDTRIKNYIKSGKTDILEKFIIDTLKNNLRKKYCPDVGTYEIATLVCHLYEKKIIKNITRDDLALMRQWVAFDQNIPLHYASPGLQKKFINWHLADTDIKFLHKEPEAPKKCADLLELFGLL